MDNRKKLLAIINPFSGTKSKAKVPLLIDEVLDKTRFAVEVAMVERENHVRDLSREAIERGFYGVVAVGGDGTVNGAATALIGSDVALAVVPCGSGNGLARHLGLPMNVRRALQVINADNVETLDYCTVNDRTFVCTCGMGFDAEVAHRFAQKSHRGLVTYAVTSLEVFARYKPQRYRLTFDGHTIEEDAFVVACANAAQYGNNAFIAPHASMQDGLLDITVMRPFNPLVAPVIGVDLFTRRLDKNVHCHIYRAREVVIERPAEGAMHIDGEPIVMPSRLTVTCHPRGVKMFIPPTAKSNA